MNSMIRVTGAVPRVNCANPQDNLEEIRTLLEEPRVAQSDLIVLPALSLCSPSCGSLLQSSVILDGCHKALNLLCEATARHSACILVGLAVDDGGRTASAMAVLFRGALLGLVPLRSAPSALITEGFSDAMLAPETVLACGDLRFCIVGSDLDDLPLKLADAAQNGCDLLVVPAYQPVYAGLQEQILLGLKSISHASGCAVALVNGGVGDTSFPWIYSGISSIYECGEQLAHAADHYESFWTSADLDLDFIRACKRSKAYNPPVYTVTPEGGHPGLLRSVRRNPWLPVEHQDRYLAELFALQVRSLVQRMQNTGLTRLVVGVSGGLDSTMALLVSASATDALGLPRENITGITMPGFGTTDRTWFNALRLQEELGVSRRDISIKQAVQLHLEDIGHSGRADTTYENAQARERTQILLDVANSTGALVVGTGDLSEEALGFCTFGGDHLANYNVNVCIPKSILRTLVGWIVDAQRMPGTEETLRDILDTPISPELLPPSEGGEIQQKTEEILGPYELHDFFLYHFLKHRLAPSKLYFYAQYAFAGELTPAFILDKLRLFLRKFCAAQFKRSCAPDAASITQVNLCGVNYHIPSDLDPSVLLSELELNAGGTP